MARSDAISARSNSRPTFEDAVALLLPGVTDAERGLFTPLGWERWTEPRAALEIDKQISEIISTSNAKTATELADAGVICPYFAAREYVVRAVERATVEIQKYRNRCAQANAMKARRKFEIEAENLAKKLELFASEIPSGPLVSDIRPGLDQEDLQALFDDQTRLIDLVAQINGAPIALREWARISSEFRQRETWDAAAVDLWLRTFSNTLADFWHLLTGQTPASSKEGGPYFRFVRAAYESIVKTNKRLEPGTWLLSSVRHKKRRPAWDQATAISENAHLPGEMEVNAFLPNDTWLVESSDQSKTTILHVPKYRRMTSVEGVRLWRTRVAAARHWVEVYRNQDVQWSERVGAHICLRHAWRYGGPVRETLIELGFDPMETPKPPGP